METGEISAWGNNGVEMRSEELMKCETSASVVLRVTITTGEARGEDHD